MSEPKTIKIDDVEYVGKDQLDEKAEKIDGMEYCIFRTYSAGVFAGYKKSMSGKEAKVVNARRLWAWSGAASLSQLAVDGTSNPSGCKFPCEVPLIHLTEVIEVLTVTEKARLSIKGVAVWKK